MSSKKRKIETREIRDSHPTFTLKELEKKGLIPKNYHLFDGNYIGGLTSPKEPSEWWNRIQ